MQTFVKALRPAQMKADSYKADRFLDGIGSFSTSFVGVGLSFLELLKKNGFDHNSNKTASIGTDLQSWSLQVLLVLDSNNQTSLKYRKLSL